MKMIYINFLRKIKPYIASCMRMLPFSHEILGIPRKRILVQDTNMYFRSEHSEKTFYKTFKGDVLQILPTHALNSGNYDNSKARTYTCENFIMQLPNAKYCHIHKSVLTDEGYQLAIVSNHPSLSQKEHALFHKLFLPKIKKVSGLGLLLSTPNDNNYFHCLFQIAPKIWSIQKEGYQIPQIDFFFLELSENNFQNEIITKLGIDNEKIVDLRVHKYVKVQYMLIAPTYYKPEPWICKQLKETFLIQSKKSNNFPKRIYISRNNASYRKLLNEKELLKVLENLDFKVLCTEGMTIREQAQIFNNAETVIALHGAALANIVFCKEETRVVELRGRSYNEGLGDVFEHLSSICNLNHYTYLCEEINNEYGSNPKYFDLKLNIKELEVALKHVLVMDSHNI
jgi:hypothetical protein